MRVIAGTYRSRQLSALPGTEIRPTSDKLRGTLFNILCSGKGAGADMEGLVFVDLFAGTGAVGIEALSRGAEQVIFVDSSPKAVGAIRQNLATLKIENGFSVLRSDAVSAVRKLEAAGMAADIIFLDPPYAGEALYVATLEALGNWSGTTDTTIIVAEHQKRSDLAESVAGLRRFRKLLQGDAALSFYRKIT